MADQPPSGSGISDHTESPAATPATTNLSEDIEEDEDDEDEDDDDFDIEEDEEDDEDEETMSPEEEAFFQQLIAGDSDDGGDLDGGWHATCVRTKLIETP